MSFKSFLSAVGHDFAKVFAWLGSTQGQATIAGVETTATAVATAINPADGLAVAGIEALINAALKQIISVETVATAAGQQSGTGTQKAAAVISAITPQIGPLLESLGVSNPTAAQIQAVAESVNAGLVGVLNAIPSPTPKP